MGLKCPTPRKIKNGKGMDAQLSFCANLSFLVFSIYSSSCEIHNLCNIVKHLLTLQNLWNTKEKKKMNLLWRGQEFLSGVVKVVDLHNVSNCFVVFFLLLTITKKEEEKMPENCRRNSKIYKNKQLQISQTFDCTKDVLSQLSSMSFHILEALYDRLIIDVIKNIFLNICDIAIIHPFFSHSIPQSILDEF